MKDYEDRKYEAWKEQVEANLLIYLKKNLLTKPSASSATTHRSVADEGASSEDASGSLAAAVQSQGETCGHSVFALCPSFFFQETDTCSFKEPKIAQGEGGDFYVKRMGEGALVGNFEKKS